MIKTIEDILREMHEFADRDSQTIGRDVLRRKIQHFADSIKVAVEENATTTPTFKDSLQVGNAEALRDELAKPQMNINKINSYDEMVSAWNDYVYNRPNERFSLASFFVWLFEKAKGANDEQ